jgi:hypothetical protein
MHIPTFLRRCTPLLLTLITATGCSLSPQPPDPSTIPLRSVALYYHRGGSLGADFEQFKLNDKKLFFECGAVSGGRHAAKEQRVIDIDASRFDRIKSESWQVRRYVVDLHAQFKAPGASTSIFYPGKLSLVLQFEDGVQKVDTSFDSIANGTEGREAVVKALVHSLRTAAGDSLCGKTAFYGLSGNR